MSWLRGLPRRQRLAAVSVLLAPWYAAYCALAGWDKLGMLVVLAVMLPFLVKYSDPFVDLSPERAALAREVRRTRVPSGDYWVDKLALAQKSRPSRPPLGPRGRALVRLLLVLWAVAVPVAAAVLRSPWWLLALPTPVFLALAAPMFPRTEDVPA